MMRIHIKFHDVSFATRHNRTTTFSPTRIRTSVYDPRLFLFHATFFSSVPRNERQFLLGAVLPDKPHASFCAKKRVRERPGSTSHAPLEFFYASPAVVPLFLPNIIAGPTNTLSSPQVPQFPGSLSLIQSSPDSLFKKREMFIYLLTHKKRAMLFDPRVFYKICHSGS